MVGDLRHTRAEDPAARCDDLLPRPRGDDIGVTDRIRVAQADNADVAIGDQVHDIPADDERHPATPTFCQQRSPLLDIEMLEG